MTLSNDIERATEAARQFSEQLTKNGLTFASPSAYAILDIQILEKAIVKEIALLKHNDSSDGEPAGVAIIDEMFNTPQANAHDSNNIYCVAGYMQTEWFNNKWNNFEPRKFVDKLMGSFDRPCIVFVKGVNKLHLMRQLVSTSIQQGNWRLTLRECPDQSDEFYVDVGSGGTDGAAFTLVFSNIDSSGSIVFSLSNFKPNMSILTLNNLYVRDFVNPPSNVDYALARFAGDGKESGGGGADAKKINVHCSNPHDGICAVRNVRLVRDKWLVEFGIPARIASVFAYRCASSSV